MIDVPDDCECRNPSLVEQEMLSAAIEKQVKCTDCGESETIWKQQP